MILSKDKLKRLANKLDDDFDFTKIIKHKLTGMAIELVDGMLISSGLTFINNIDKVPEKFYDNINALVDAYMNNRVEDVLLTIPDLQMDFLNIKSLNDELEQKWIAINAEAAVEAIKYWALKKK